tara:strand:- start:12722 stop:14398 length:1677 start_codon:yes stop_codon:yes gene_type:complete
MVKVILAALAAFALSLGAVVVMLVTNSGAEQTAAAKPEVNVERKTPRSGDSPMTPVTAAEAERRTTLHSEQQEGRGNQYVAPPVITQVKDFDPTDEVAVKLFGEDFPVTPEPIRQKAEPTPEPEPEPKPEPEVVEVQPEPKPNSYEGLGQYIGDYRERLRINVDRGFKWGVKPLTEPDAGLPSNLRSSLLDTDVEAVRVALGLDQENSLSSALYHYRDSAFAKRGDEERFEPYRVAGGYSDPVVEPPVRPRMEGYTTYDYDPYTTQQYDGLLPEQRSAARPMMTGVDQYGQAFSTNDRPNPYTDALNGPVVLARSGDMTNASLIYGFNSDDVRGLPIYAVVSDYLSNGTAGPLNGAKMQGQVAYSRDNAAIIFSKATLTNGREIPVNAIAVSYDARPGVAADVNHHYLSRYGALFLGGLLEGFGEVGLAQMESSGDTIIINTGDGNASSDSDEYSTGEIVAGALRPIGENISDVAKQGFNRSATISAPAGLPFALVFTQTLILDPATGTRAWNPRTGQFEVYQVEQTEQAPQTTIPGGNGAIPQGSTLEQSIYEGLNQ